MEQILDLYGNAQISNATGKALFLMLIFCFIAPVVITWITKEKSNGKIFPIFIGVIGYFILAQIIEPLIHIVFLYFDYPFQKWIVNNFVCRVLYSAIIPALIAGIGKFFLYKYLSLKKDKDRSVSLMSAMGYSSIEMIFNGAFLALSLYSVASLIASTSLTEVLQGIPQESLNNYLSLFDTIYSPASFVYLLILEKIAVFMIQCSHSIFVYFSVFDQKWKKLFFVSIFLQIISNLILVLCEEEAISCYVFIPVLFVYALILLYFAIKLYKTGIKIKADNDYSDFFKEYKRDVQA